MRFQPGQSGNPRGKPKGAAKVEPLRQLIREAVPGILQTLAESALAGDVAASKLLLERVLPPLRPTSEPVRAGVAGDTLTAKASHICDKVLAGELPPDTGKELLDSLTALARIHEADELADRVAALEARLMAGKP